VVGIIFLNIVVKLHSALMFCFFLILGHNTIVRNIFLPGDFDHEHMSCDMNSKQFNALKERQLYLIKGHNID
jgi:hypothetical protein